MDYSILLDLATELGYEFAVSGAETFRVEDSIKHVLNSYNIESDVFAIPNSLIVGIISDTGQSYMKIRRIGYHGNNLDAIEKLNALSRKICAQHPEPEEALQWLSDVRNSVLSYSFPAMLLGDFIGAFGFSSLFGCSISDAIFAGMCGLIIGLVNHFMAELKSNPLFSTFAASFFMAVFAYLLGAFGLSNNADAINIGALMLLVPGLLFTNGLRDIIYGDTNSGINRIVQVILIAVSLAMGNAFAWNAVSHFIAIPSSITPVQNSLLVTSVGAMLGCIGFSVIFNIHGPGGLLCIAGGILTWLIYNLSLHLGSGELAAYFWGTTFAGLYAETMARVRKYPAFSYLVVSLFPLIPGAGIYYSMRHVLSGDMQLAASQGLHTAAVAGIMAISILLVSTSVRLYTTWSHIRKQ